MSKFELVVPAYNESKNLPLLIGRAIDAAKNEGLTPEEFQFVIVNNGSRDNSAEILNDLAKGEMGKWFRVVTVEINQGYGYGLWQGLKSTTASIVGWSHADMQCDPADAIKCYKDIKTRNSKNNFIKGVRSGRDWKDRLVSRVFEIFSHLILGLSVYEINAQPKVFNRELLEAVTEPPKSFAFDLYVLYKAQKQNFNISTIPVLFPPRIHGISNWASNFFSRYKTILGMINYMLQLRKEEGPL